MEKKASAKKWATVGRLLLKTVEVLGTLAALAVALVQLYQYLR